MKTRTLAAVAGLGGLAVVAAVLSRTQLREMLQTRRYLARQIRCQYPGLPPAAALDFSPFEAALRQLSQARISELDALLADAGALDIGRLLRGGQVSAEELVLIAVQRIRLAPDLNAVIELNPDALELARASDRERRAGRSRGPLHGTPVLLKDNIATGDHMHNTAGALALQGAGSDRDSFVAHRLRAAGTIPLGKTNMSEWACYMASDSVNGFSALGGQTHNPHGEFDVGGSSSGSAAAVAAGLAPIAIGTETSGSLVYPASQHGIVSLKPSLGLISRDRIIPITDALDTAGPMTRSVADTAALMSVLVGYDSNDPPTTHARALAGVDWLGALQRDGLRGVRVGAARVLLRSGDSAAFARAVSVLRLAGATVVEVPNPPRIECEDLFESGFKLGLAHYLDSLRGYVPVGSLQEIIALNRADPQVYAPYGQETLERAAANTSTPAQHAQRTREVHQQAAQALRGHMAEHRVDMLMGLSNYLTGAYAPAGFPAICVPCGVRKSGEPIGMTLIGDYLDDLRLVAAAYAFEQTLAEHVP
jgi:amidase